GFLAGETLEMAERQDLFARSNPAVANPNVADRRADEEQEEGDQAEGETRQQDPKGDAEGPAAEDNCVPGLLGDFGARRVLIGPGGGDGPGETEDHEDRHLDGREVVPERRQFSEHEGNDGLHSRGFARVALRTNKLMAAPGRTT